MYCGYFSNPLLNDSSSTDPSHPKTPGSNLTEADVIAWAKTRVAGYKSPKHGEFREELARTATGKLQKFKWREPFWEDQGRQIH